MIYESDYFVGSALNGDSLSHEGVPGQRWGIKHGPPYPIKDRSSAKERYSVGKMTDKTKASLKESGKLKPAGTKKSGESSKVENAAKSVVSKVSSSFKNWKNSKAEDLATRDAKSTVVKNWQKKQLRISDLSNQDLRDRIERKKLEASYRHALRGDFSDPKNWNTNSKDAKSSSGKKAAATILSKVGNAAVEGLAKGLTSKIEYKMTARSKAKVDRKEARRNAIAKVMTEAAADRAKYKADQKSEAWKARQERKAAARRQRERQQYNDTMNRARTGSPVVGSGLSQNYWYYASPDDYDIR